MPRKENLSIEERLERAKELFTRKQHEKHKEISHLYKTRIYKLAKKAVLFFCGYRSLYLLIGCCLI